MCFRWICIYPAYVNNQKTLAQGRKIAKEKCVENPTHQEIRDVLLAADLKACVENKLYSRERSKELLYRGRIRVCLTVLSNLLLCSSVIFVQVQLKNDDGSALNEKFPTRDSVLLHLGEMIPKLKTRQTKSGGEQTAAASGGKGKGKGKGRR